MKPHVLRLLVVLNAALLLALLLIWIRPDGSLRGVAWQPPAPHLTDFAAQLPTLPSPAPSDTTSFMAILERPLFSGTRRPPPPAPPPPAAVAEAPPDNFSTAKLTGIFNSGGSGGIIMRIADKDKRLQLNQAVEGWTLKSISGRDVTFTKGGKSRVMQLQRAELMEAPAGVAPLGGAAGSSPAARAKPRSPKSYPFAPASIPSGAAAAASDTNATGAAAPAAATNASGDPSAGTAAPSKQAPRAVFGGTRSK